MGRLRVLCIVAMLAWLPYVSSLWPLPPAQTRALVKVYEEQLAEVQSSSDSKRRFMEERYPEVENHLRQFVEEADEWELVFWLQWVGRLTLLTLGIVGWTLLLIKSARWRIVIVTSTALLWLNQALFHQSTYSYFTDAWAEGRSGFKFLPSAIAIPTLYFAFLLPLTIGACTFLAFLWRIRPETRGHQATAL